MMCCTEVNCTKLHCTKLHCTVLHYLDVFKVRWKVVGLANVHDDAGRIVCLTAEILLGMHAVPL